MQEERSPYGLEIFLACKERIRKLIYVQGIIDTYFKAKENIKNRFLNYSDMHTCTRITRVRVNRYNAKKRHPLACLMIYVHIKNE